jgi:NarL family two-component system response regulator LiaR
MRKSAILYGIALALILIFSQWLQIHFWKRNLTVEVYVGLAGILFLGVGIFAGYQWQQRKKKYLHVNLTSDVDVSLAEQFGLSKRETEVLQKMSEGLSNQEIADALFVSLNTVKTHTANIFIKLEVKRRTQAIQKARELKIVQTTFIA